MLKHRDCMQLEVKFATLKSDKLLWRVWWRSFIRTVWSAAHFVLEGAWSNMSAHTDEWEISHTKQQRQLGWISLTDNYVWIKPPNLINEGCSIHRTFCVLVTWLQEMSLRWGGRGQHFIKMLAVLCFLCAFVSLANGTPSPTTHS